MDTKDAKKEGEKKGHNKRGGRKDNKKKDLSEIKDKQKKAGGKSGGKSGEKSKKTAPKKENKDRPNRETKPRARLLGPEKKTEPVEEKVAVKDDRDIKTIVNDMFRWNAKPQQQNSFSDYERYLQIFRKGCFTVPEYMKKNLGEMPANKGYIWKGIYCYGEQPEESDTRVMFEKIDREVMRIHEWSGREYKVFEKLNGEKKKLISKETVKRPEIIEALINTIASDM